MARKIGVLLVFSLLLISGGDSKPSKRKHRDSEGEDELKIEEKIEETISEEKNETLVTVLAKFNDFYTDILPELRLTISRDCDEEDKDNSTTTNHELALASNLDCLSLDAAACAASLKKQFSRKIKEEYVREIKVFISKTFDIYAAVLKDLPSNDAHEKAIQTFLGVLSEDLPKLTAELELDLLDRMFRAMQDDLKPNFLDTKIDDESKKLYEEIFKKHAEERPTVESLNEKRVAYVNKIWNELNEDLHAVELFKRL